MKKTWIIALVMASLAAISNYIYASNLHKQATGGKKITVAVTINPVKKGALLDAENIGLREIPAAYVDKRYITKKNIPEIAGLPMAITSPGGQIITWTDFEHRDDAREKDLANLIDAGQRAMTIPVDSSLSLGGLLKPGHRVDIIGTFNTAGSNKEQNRSITLLQNITVLATGDKLDVDKKEDSNFSTITLGVTVEQSELLSYASSNGTLSAVLRGYQDLSITTDIPPVGENDIFKTEKLNRIQKNIHPKLKIERLQEIK